MSNITSVPLSCEPPPPVSFTICTESPDQPEIAELLKVGADLARSMHCLDFLLDITELQADGVRVFVAREFQDATSTSSGHGKALGMAALVPLSTNLELGKAVEIKRMFVHATARRRGVGKALIKRIEEEALKGGYDRIMVETGRTYDAAKKMYETLGYTYIARFGPYKNSEPSVCMQIWLR
jgi:GNAT superfamily N-acetyltransferase